MLWVWVQALTGAACSCSGMMRSIAQPQTHILSPTPCRRCRAWEQQTPLAPLFRRQEEELARAHAQADRLVQENAQLAALLADADLARLAGGCQSMI